MDRRKLSLNYLFAFSSLFKTLKITHSISMHWQAQFSRNMMFLLFAFPFINPLNIQEYLGISHQGCCYTSRRTPRGQSMKSRHCTSALAMRPRNTLRQSLGKHDFTLNARQLLNARPYSRTSLDRKRYSRFSPRPRHRILTASCPPLLRQIS